MKRIFTIIISVLLTASVFAQAPQKMSYQAVVRDASDNLVTNQTVGMQISILQGSTSGTVVYTETQTPTTNDSGLLSIEFGGGVGFDTINWASGSYFIKTETDLTGGSTFTITGTSQLLSVPYALYASKLGIDGTNYGDMLFWDGNEWIIIPSGNNGEVLMNINGTPAWSLFSPGLAIVHTDSIYDITGISAFVMAEIISEGGNAVTERGILYGVNPNLNLNDDDNIVNGSGIGSYTTEIDGLNIGTLYYSRAYAQNSAGTVYGDEISFSTCDFPTVTTNLVSDILVNSAISGGNVISDGGMPVIECGVCISISPDPTISDVHTIDGAGIGVFTSNITGLTESTTYYVRAYATNSIGTSYGQQETFITGGVADYDGNIYSVVQIGTQFWMGENLKTTSYNDGAIIPNMSVDMDWAGLSTPAYCWHYDDEATYKEVYGGLYNWYAVETDKLCPTGWHVPGWAEWDVLKDYLGGAAVAGGKMKETGFAHWNSPNTGATNSSGFTALPGGYCTHGTVSLGSLGYWWCAEEQSSSQAYYIQLYSNDDSIGVYNYTQKGYGMSIRCVKD